jgi:hypothetical protein
MFVMSADATSYARRDCQSAPWFIVVVVNARQPIATTGLAISAWFARRKVDEGRTGPVSEKEAGSSLSSGRVRRLIEALLVAK